jgi:hypothetical protein
VGVLAGCCAKNKEDAINTNAQEIFIFGTMPLALIVFPPLRLSIDLAANAGGPLFTIRL